MRKQIFQLVRKIVIIGGAVWAVLTFVVCLYRMRGNSMFPMVKDGDFCIFYRLEESQIKDIVLYTDPEGTARTGRICAVEGQEVEVIEGRGLVVDGYDGGSELPYPVEPGTVEYPLTVPEGSVFILNDYSLENTDSREYGCIPKKDIKGKLLFLMRRRGF